jgi:uncharacterized protein
LALNSAKPLFGGVLTVIDPEIDPTELYRFYRSLGVTSVDFLLPDAHYGNPPLKLTPRGSATPYADWLIEVFDLWFDEGDASFHIRIFENIIDLIFCDERSTDYLGGRPNGILVIETDGGMEPVDVLKICGEGFTKLGYNVLSESIADITIAPLLRKYQEGAAALCAECRACHIAAVCGGGYLPHRFSPTNGFDNPSIYCQDLMKLIIHIRSRIVASLPEKARRRLA